jgi:hypothetical protein
VTLPNQPDDEELLAALLLGERRADEPSVAARFTNAPELHHRYQRLRALAGDLDRHGAEDRAALTAALSGPDAPRTTAGPTPRRAGPRPFRFLLLMTAAAMVAVAVGILLLPTKRADEGSTLGGPKQALGDAFRWNLPLPKGTRYVLVLFDGGPDGPELQRIDDLTVQQWQPDPDQLQKLPNTLAWMVQVVEPGGRVRASTEPVTVRVR